MSGGSLRALAAVLAVLACLASFGCSPFGSGDSGSGETASPAEPTFADRGEELVSELSPSQLLGQRILLSFDGTELPALVADRLRAGLAPGVVLFDRNYASAAQLRELTGQIQSAAAAGPVDLPALVMVDQEGGDVRRVPGPPELSAEAMGETLTAEEIGEQGRLTGGFLADLGVNTDLAPVADIGSEGGALADEDRTFSAEPEAVSGAAKAFADGLHAEGVAATAKHFPGFGSAAVNTDFGTAVIERTPADAQREIAPFRGMVDEGVPLVMLSTAIYPEYGASPAALTSAVTQDLLRGEMGFTGVTVTDALDTPALAAYAPPADVAVEALDAPTDLLLYAQSTQASLDAEVAGEGAIAAGVLGKAELRRAAARILTLRLALEDTATLGELVDENSR